MKKFEEKVTEEELAYDEFQQATRAAVAAEKALNDAMAPYQKAFNEAMARLQKATAALQKYALEKA